MTAMRWTFLLLVVMGCDGATDPLLWAEGTVEHWRGGVFLIVEERCCAHVPDELLLLSGSPPRPIGQDAIRKKAKIRIKGHLVLMPDFDGIQDVWSMNVVRVDVLLVPQFVY